MEDKILGGALLIAGAREDYISGLADKEKTLIRVALIKRYELGDLTLKDLNGIW